MSRGILTAVIAALVAVGAFVAIAVAASGDDDTYLIRAAFDSASFAVVDEDVRVGGANVGHIEEVDVSRPGEIISREGGGRAIPGKAILVMEITDPGFTDFRQDASCVIRPQSLIGEKYVDCRPTVPRRPGEEHPPPLEEIPEGQPGAGQHLLPLENNGKTVDFDLVNNIMRRPYSERFRIILNELGASFAARGEDLAEIVERANPTMREVNRVFGILTRQRDQLAQLAADSDAIMRPLARERRRVVGFMRNSGEAAEASAQYSAQISESFRKFPTFLREFRQTMAELGGFAEEATPVARGLNVAAPSFTRTTQALEPFSEASTVALKSFGEAGEEAGPLFAEARPVVRRASGLARSGAKPLFDLSSFLSSTRSTGGFEGLMDLIYNTTAAMNGYDSFGHFARTLVVPTNCLNYETSSTTGCISNFLDFGFSSMTYDQMLDLLYAMVEDRQGAGDEEESGGVSPEDAGGAAPDDDAGDSGDTGDGDGGDEGSDSGGDEGDEGAPGPGEGSGPEASGGQGGEPEAGQDGGGESSPGSAQTGGGAGADLLSYLLGP